MAKTVAVDFDGVIHAYGKGWLDGTIYDKPVPGAFSALSMLMDRYAVFIHTTRRACEVADWISERANLMTCWEPDGHPGCEFWNERGTLLVTDRKLPAIASPSAPRCAGPASRSLPGSRPSPHPLVLSQPGAIAGIAGMPLPVALRVAALDRVIAFLHVRFPAAEGAVARLVVVPVVPIATGAGARVAHGSSPPGSTFTPHGEQ